MRITPSEKYQGQPCSFVSVGCAFENVTGEVFDRSLPEELRNDGWLTLTNMNTFIRSALPVTKKVYYKRTERKTLSEFLSGNESRCLVCVLGHFIYVSSKDYWSFFDNEDDKVVCVWYIS